jgi:acetyl esterase/lipase
MGCICSKLSREHWVRKVSTAATFVTTFREFRESLNYKWGVYDVEDTIAAAKYLADKGIADRKKIVVMGGSAGGYTTLLALEHSSSSDCFEYALTIFQTPLQRESTCVESLICSF